MEQATTATQLRQPWNRAKLVGQKSLLKLNDNRAIRIRLQIANRTRGLAMFDSGIDWVVASTHVTPATRASAAAR
jgi:hypothetical protein